MGARLVQPEHRRPAGGPGTGDGEVDPVADGGVLGLAHPPDVPGLDVMGQQRLATTVHDLDRARRRDLERLVMRAVLLGLLRHEADVGRRAHRRGIEGAVLATVVDGLGVEVGVGVVRDHELGVLELAVAVPHLARGADGGGHRRVDDHVGGHVEVGDPAVRVDHGQAGPVAVGRLDSLGDGGTLVVGHDGPGP